MHRSKQHRGCLCRYFLDNVAGWILELDRGKGIPFEGNFSEWLEARHKRLEGERKQQAGLQRLLDQELEFVRSKAKGQQKKGKARMRRYDELVSQVSHPGRPPNSSEGRSSSAEYNDASNISASFHDRLG